MSSLRLRAGERGPRAGGCVMHLSRAEAELQRACPCVQEKEDEEGKLVNAGPRSGIPGQGAGCADLTQGGRRSSDWAGHWECGLVDGHLDFHPNTKHQMSSHCPWTNLHTAISHRLMSACLNSPSRAVNDLTWPSFCNMLLTPRSSDPRLSTASTTTCNLSFLVPEAQSPYLAGVCSHFIPLK